MNLALIAYRDLLGETQEGQRMGPARVRWAITLKAGRKPTPQRPPYVDPLLSPGDPGVALAHVRRVLAATLGGAPKRLGRWARLAGGRATSV